MCEFFKKCGKWMKRPEILFVMALAVAAPGTALAELLGVDPDNPLITFAGGEGATSYMEGNDQFSVDANPTLFQLVTDGPVVFITPDSSGLEAFTIDIEVDDTGTLVGGVPGDDLYVFGEVTVGAATYSGVLLTGEVTGFGYLDTGPDGLADEYDFTFNVTGGQLASLYPTGVVGVTLFSERSDFVGDFTVNFAGKPKGSLGELPAPPAALGDRVWEDLNNNGIQDCLDGGLNGTENAPFPDGIIGNAGDTGTECGAGIDGIPVDLYAGDCTISLGRQEITSDGGFYLFTDLTPGEDYCVKFGKPGPEFCSRDGFDLGVPQFTSRNVGNDDTIDSDVDPDGTSDPVIELKGTNRTVDAGIVCPAKIGDRVWLDLNDDGIQQCSDTNGDGHIGSGDMGDECDASAFPGATVTLYKCDGDTPTDKIVGTRTTGDIQTGTGFYMFGADGSNLPPGSYYVNFKKPAGYEFAQFELGGDDAFDSNCRPDGSSECVTVGSGGINLDRDCGLIKPQCELEVDKKCRLEPEPTPPFEKCDGKLQQFTVEWNGEQPINITGSKNIASTPLGTVNPNEAVTFSGFSNNDVEVYFESTGSEILKGKSKFHVSCSDSEFNNPDDCGKDAGDGKGTDDKYDNTWLLAGFVDKEGVVVDCNATSDGPFSSACSFTKTELPNCDTAGDPTMLTLKYVGGCGLNNNTQDSSKTSCTYTGGAPSGDVSIRASGKDDFSNDIYTVMDSSGIAIGDTFDLSYGGDKLESNTFVELTGDISGQQLTQFHTSCSQDLAVGDEFGGLEVVAINGQTGGRDVTYQYTVTNEGPSAVSGITLTDDKLGVIAPEFFDLDGPSYPDSMTFTSDAVLITGTTTNTATATVGGESCGSDMVTVTVEEPLIPVSCNDIKDIIAVSVIWNGADGVDVETESGQMFKDLQNGSRITFQEAGTGNDVELYLTGNAIGTSVFHVSCSDPEMDGNDDCGMPQGDGKNNDGNYINDWKLDGMIGENGSFDCMLDNPDGSDVVEPEPTTSSSAPPPPPPPAPATGSDVTGATTLDLGDDKKAKWALTNNGSQDVFITEVTMTWPSQHEKLKKFKLAGDFAKDVNDSTSPTIVPDDKAFESDANKRKLKKGETRNLEIEFTKDYKDHSQSDFTITVEFDSGDVVTF